ncbi:dynein light chain Tctex-type 5-A-like [Watersipora subatra]|uniref:dynein light chain Tctex-type 5-A-like n=1 Tax=Watersipora subatra TaxID=2589382 RepID=UPI00355AED3A
MSASSSYIQTGKVNAAISTEYSVGGSLPSQTKAVRYNQGTPQCNIDSESAGRGSILKKSKNNSSPSAMSLLTSDPDHLKIPIAVPPTYQLHPAPGTQFQACKISKIIQTILEEIFSTKVYEKEECGQLVETATSEIMKAVKDIQRKRYKLICTVSVGERRSLAMQVASRCAWNEDTDSYATAVYENKTLSVIATVYGAYTD